jgi:hypothetical protein
MAELFPIAVLSTATGKNSYLCVLCDLSEAGGELLLTYLHSIA